jgi:hypothetical protein
VGTRRADGVEWRDQLGGGDVSAPERIWLQDDEGIDPDGDWFSATWCGEQINDEDVEYIRADLAVDRDAVLEEVAIMFEQVEYESAVERVRAMKTCP